MCPFGRMSGGGLVEGRALLGQITPLSELATYQAGMEKFLYLNAGVLSTAVKRLVHGGIHHRENITHIMV